MKELEAKKAELTERLKNILAARESLDRGSDSFGSTLAKSHEEESIIKSELEFIEIILQGIEFAGDFMKNLPSIDQLKFMALSKAEAIAPKIKSALSELFGGIKISETEKPAEPEMNEKTFAVYIALKNLLTAGEKNLASQLVKYRLDNLKVMKDDQAIYYTLEAMRVLIEAGHEKSPMVLFVNLFKKTE